MTDAAVLYDEDCGLCRWSADRLRRWDRRRALRFVPLGSPEADRLLEALTPAERWASWHLVDEGGIVTSGGAAVGPVLRRLPFGGPLATAAERSPRVTDRAYRWVARHRDGLGRLLGERACAVDPSAPRR